MYNPRPNTYSTNTIQHERQECRIEHFALKVNLQGFSSDATSPAVHVGLFFMRFCIQETKEYKEAALTLASILTRVRARPLHIALCNVPPSKHEGLQPVRCRLCHSAGGPMPFFCHGPPCRQCAEGAATPRARSKGLSTIGVRGWRPLKTLRPFSFKTKHPLWPPSQ